MVVGQKLAPTHCNFSHQDQIWKDYVMKEISTSKKRDRDYNFLVQEYRTLRKDVLELRAKRDQSEKTSSPKAQVTKPIETHKKPTHSVASASDHDELKLPPLEAPPQDMSNPFPLVTSKEIGWRSERKYNLEVYGRWGKPKYSIINQLKWPNDAVP